MEVCTVSDDDVIIIDDDDDEPQQTIESTPYPVGLFAFSDTQSLIQTQFHPSVANKCDILPTLPGNDVIDCDAVQEDTGSDVIDCGVVQEETGSDVIDCGVAEKETRSDDVIDCVVVEKETKSDDVIDCVVAGKEPDSDVIDHSVISRPINKVMPETTNCDIPKAGGVPMQNTPYTSHSDFQKTTQMHHTTNCPPMHVANGPPIQTTNHPPVCMANGQPIHTTNCPPIHTASGPPMHAANGPPVCMANGQPIHTASCPPIHTTNGQPKHTDSGPPMRTANGQPICTTNGQPIHTTNRPPIHTDSGPPIHTANGKPIHTVNGQPGHHIGPPIHTTYGHPMHPVNGAPMHFPNSGQMVMPNGYPMHVQHGFPMVAGPHVFPMPGLPHTANGRHGFPMPGPPHTANGPHGFPMPGQPHAVNGLPMQLMHPMQAMNPMLHMNPMLAMHGFPMQAMNPMHSVHGIPMQGRSCYEHQSLNRCRTWTPNGYPIQYVYHTHDGQPKLLQPIDTVRNTQTNNLLAVDIGNKQSVQVQELNTEPHTHDATALMKNSQQLSNEQQKQDNGVGHIASSTESLTNDLSGHANDVRQNTVPKRKGRKRKKVRGRRKPQRRPQSTDDDDDGVDDDDDDDDDSDYETPKQRNDDSDQETPIRRYSSRLKKIAETSTTESVERNQPLKEDQNQHKHLSVDMSKCKLMTADNDSKTKVQASRDSVMNCNVVKSKPIVERADASCDDAIVFVYKDNVTSDANNNSDGNRDKEPLHVFLCKNAFGDETNPDDIFQNVLKENREIEKVSDCQDGVETNKINGGETNTLVKEFYDKISKVGILPHDMNEDVVKEDNRSDDDVYQYSHDGEETSHKPNTASNKSAKKRTQSNVRGTSKEKISRKCNASSSQKKKRTSKNISTKRTNSGSSSQTIKDKRTMRQCRVVVNNVSVTTCTLCGKNCKTEAILAIHMTKNHSKKNLFKCNSCIRTYKFRSQLVRHQNQAHSFMKQKEKYLAEKNNLVIQDKTTSKGRKFCCNLCQKSYPTKSRTLEHIRTVHFSIKPHKCQICTATFTRPSRVREHVKRVHNNISKMDSVKRKSSSDMGKHKRSSQLVIDAKKTKTKKKSLCADCGNVIKGRFKRQVTDTDLALCKECSRNREELQSLKLQLQSFTSGLTMNANDMTCDDNKSRHSLSFTSNQGKGMGANLPIEQNSLQSQTVNDTKETNRQGELRNDYQDCPTTTKNQRPTCGKGHGKYGRGRPSKNKSKNDVQGLDSMKRKGGKKTKTQHGNNMKLSLATLLQGLKEAKETRSPQKDSGKSCEMKKLICEPCQRIFRTKPLFTQHMEIHANLGLLVCVECGKFFAESETLERHRMVHNDIQERQSTHTKNVVQS